MKKIYLLTLCISAHFACQQTPKFTVQGSIADAEGSTLYLEQVTDSAVIMLDSLTLPENGDYVFHSPQPRFPEFYRLRLQNQSILFAIDSCEEILINSQNRLFATNYTVENSKNSADIQQLRNSGFALQKAVDSAHANNTWNEAEIVKMIDEHKALARNIIMNNTRSTAAYYAVNQMVNGIYLFLPSNRNDRSYWGAVATAYQVFMPENPRTALLKNVVLTAKQAANITEYTAEEIGAIDIELPNYRDENVKLSSLKGKVVLVDFSAYALENATAHTLFLRELYNFYHDEGFEIYQVSLDENKLFWLEQTRDIPWICVRDKHAPNCKYLLSYNVQAIPAWFLIDKNGDIVAGKELDADNLSNSIKRQLLK